MFCIFYFLFKNKNIMVSGNNCLFLTTNFKIAYFRAVIRWNLDNSVIKQFESHAGPCLFHNDFSSSPSSWFYCDSRHNNWKMNKTKWKIDLTFSIIPQRRKQGLHEIVKLIRRLSELSEKVRRQSITGENCVKSAEISYLAKGFILF